MRTADLLEVISAYLTLVRRTIWEPDPGLLRLYALQTGCASPGDIHAIIADAFATMPLDQRRAETMAIAHRGVRLNLQLYAQLIRRELKTLLDDRCAPAVGFSPVTCDRIFRWVNGSGSAHAMIDLERQCAYDAESVAAATPTSTDAMIAMVRCVMSLEDDPAYPPRSDPVHKTDLARLGLLAAALRLYATPRRSGEEPPPRRYDTIRVTNVTLAAMPMPIPAFAQMFSDDAVGSVSGIGATYLDALARLLSPR